MFWKMFCRKFRKSKVNPKDFIFRKRIMEILRSALIEKIDGNYKAYM